MNQDCFLLGSGEALIAVFLRVWRCGDLIIRPLVSVLGRRRPTRSLVIITVDKSVNECWLVCGFLCMLYL